MSEPIHFVELMGIPAAGKTTLARTFTDQGYHLIDTDAIRIETGFTRQNGMDDEGNEETCMRAYRALAEGKNVVFDAPSVQATRKSMLALVEQVEHELARVVYRELIVIRIPHNVAIERDRVRRAAKGEAPYPEDLFARHIIHFEKGLSEIAYEGWDNIQFVYAKDVDG